MKIKESGNERGVAHSFESLTDISSFPGEEFTLSAER